MRCVEKVKEKYFETKYRPENVLLNVNAMNYFKFELQLKFGNKICSSIVVNFHTV
jgi:hypothetical protein